MNKKIDVISVIGPTASGKTRLAVEIARKLNGEVVSADSMQIYKNMDIATAKPTTEEMCGVPHHLIGFLDPEQTFSVARFVKLAGQAAADIHNRGKMPVICGGTGLYVDSLLNNIEFAEGDTDEELRKELYLKAEKEGVQSLISELAQFDPQSAENMNTGNVKRIVRAIEIYRTTGITLTEQNRRSRLRGTPYAPVKIGLKAKDRQYLYDRINKRVDIMVQSGLLEEAKDFFKTECGKTAVKAIGYKELEPYFNGSITLEQALEELKKQTRRYAKRQLTWFMRDAEIKWFDIDTYTDVKELDEDVFDYIGRKLKK
ncbi:MAG: tRNA (adenosine(37)-N6)-dimethylallyltransferase MiaA [Clostridia bacterium]|nr:tRNA (adenosine(37)-N6)-dimethylallyltransferase MiaA [Clostridia bacterium]